MLTLVHMVGSFCAIALSFYLISMGKPEGTEIRPFLRNDLVRVAYIMAILTLMFWGGAWFVYSASSLV